MEFYLFLHLYLTIQIVLSYYKTLVVVKTKYWGTFIKYF